MCRSPSWGIYTHLQGPNCPAKAVSGWRAVELALDMRASNIPTPREANRVSIGSFNLPFVSLLDDEHCKAEMAAVTISQRDFLPLGPSADIGDGDSRPDAVENRGDHCHWREWCHKELKIVDALDRGICGTFAKLVRQVLKRERLSLYVERSGPWSALSLSEKDERPMRAIPSLSTRSRVLTPKTKSTASKGRSRRPNVLPRGGLSYAFPRDAIGKPGEYALYSQQQLIDGRRVLKFGGSALDEFTYYRLSGLRPEAPKLPFSSASSPEMFDWCNDVPTALVEHWKGNPKSAPYGPVARLKPAILASLRARTQTQAQV